METDPLVLEKHRLDQYRRFADAYQVEDFETLVKLYDIDDLQGFLPAQPSEKEKQILRELIGVTGVKGYIDYIKNNNTFELVMQWQEQTGNFGSALFFNSGA